MATSDLGAITAYAAAVAGGYTGTKAEFETSMAGVADKANRAANPTAGNLAALDASGNLTDSGKTAEELDQVFMAIYGTTTSAEIEAAYQAGKNIFCKYGDYLCPYRFRGSEQYHTFKKIEMILNEDYDPELVVRDVYVNNSSWSSVIDNILLDRRGGTMTGALKLSGAPTLDLHAATKKYVDDSVSTAITGAIEGSY